MACSALIFPSLDAFRSALDFCIALFDRIKVGEEQFGVDDVDVVQWIDAYACYVDDLGIVKTANDVRERIGLTDVTEKLIAEAFALGGAFRPSLQCR